QEAFRVALDQIGPLSGSLRGCDDILSDYVPGEVHINVTEIRITQNRFDACKVVRGRRNNTAEAGMSPDDRGVRVALEEGSDLIEIGGAGSVFCHDARERNVDIVVEDDDKARLTSEIEDPIQSWILKASDFAGNFRRHKFLVNGEFTNPREHAWECLEGSADVIRSIHVRRVEAGYHGIKTCLLFFRQRHVS